jgi:hypothetical protein
MLIGNIHQLKCGYKKTKVLQKAHIDRVLTMCYTYRGYKCLVPLRPLAGT